MTMVWVPIIHAKSLCWTTAAMTTKKIENAIADKYGGFIMDLSKTRIVKSETINDVNTNFDTDKMDRFTFPTRRRY